MSKKDLFYGDVEGRMEELKQKPITKKKKPEERRLTRAFQSCSDLLLSSV